MSDLMYILNSRLFLWYGPCIAYMPCVTGHSKMSFENIGIAGKKLDKICTSVYVICIFTRYKQPLGKSPVTKHLFPHDEMYNSPKKNENGCYVGRAAGASETQ